MKKYLSLFSQERVKDGIDFALLPVCFLLAYGSALLVTYGHTDDYSALFNHQLGWRQMNIDWYVASGRPLLAFLNDWLLNRVDSVDGLVKLRILGLLLLLWLGLQIRRLLLVSQVPGHEATLVASACVLTPSAAVFVGWAILSVCMLAGVAAMFAFASAERTWLAWNARQHGNWGSMRAAAWLGIAVAALLTAFLIYQPLAPLFLLAALMRFAFEKNPKRGQRDLLVMLLVYLCTMALYLAIYKLVMVPAQAGNIAAIGRGSLDLSPAAVAKALAKTMPMLWGGWEFFRSGVHPESLPWPVRWTVTMVGVALLLPIGLWRIGCSVQCDPLRRMIGISLVVLVWLVSLLPMLVLKENYLPTRTLFYSYASLCVLIYLGLKTLTENRVWPRRLTTVFMILLATQAGLGLWDGVVRFQGREFAIIKNAIDAMPERPARLAFIQPCTGFGPELQLRSHHEYFIFSSHADWVPSAMVNLIWNQREGIGRGHPDAARLRYTEVERIRPGQPLPIEYDAVLDAQALLCGVPAR